MDNVPAREPARVTHPCPRVCVSRDSTKPFLRLCLDLFPAYASPQWLVSSCCTSVDEIICHGIPDSTVLTEGMIINVDVTVYYKGYHGDCSEMFTVGEIDEAARNLIQVGVASPDAVCMGFLHSLRNAPNVPWDLGRVLGRVRACRRVTTPLCFERNGHLMYDGVLDASLESHMGRSQRRPKDFTVKEIPLKFPDVAYPYPAASLRDTPHVFPPDRLSRRLTMPGK